MACREHHRMNEDVLKMRMEVLGGQGSELGRTRLEAKGKEREKEQSR